MLGIRQLTEFAVLLLGSGSTTPRATRTTCSSLSVMRNDRLYKQSALWQLVSLQAAVGGWAFLGAFSACIVEQQRPAGTTATRPWAWQRPIQCDSSGSLHYCMGGRLAQ